MTDQDRERERKKSRLRSRMLVTDSDEKKPAGKKAAPQPAQKREAAPAPEEKDDHYELAWQTDWSTGTIRKPP